MTMSTSRSNLASKQHSKKQRPDVNMSVFSGTERSEGRDNHTHSKDGNARSTHVCSMASAAIDVRADNLHSTAEPAGGGGS